MTKVVGLQRRETLAKSGYTLIERIPRGVILQSPKGIREIWSANDHGRGHIIQVGRWGYKFAREYPIKPKYYIGQQLAGVGKFGDSNFGDFLPKDEATKDVWEAALRPHIGELVALSGGGSFGKLWVARLADVKREDDGVRAVLTDLDPKWSSYGDDNTFEPLMGSWQIFALEEVRP